MSQLHTALAEGLRARIRGGVDLAALVGATVGTAGQLTELADGVSLRALLAAAIPLALAACGLLGVLGRARWTPVAYVGLVMIGNALFLTSYGPWFGMGVVYVLTTALAFVFLPPRWWWRVCLMLVATPLGIGVLTALGVLAPAPLHLDDSLAWRRATLAAATALIGIAVIVSYAVGQLVRARRQIERALVLEREQRSERERVEDAIARARRADLIAELAADVGADIGGALAIIEARAQALARALRGAEARECLDDVLQSATNAGSTMRSLTAFAPEAQVTDARGNVAAAVRTLATLVRRTLPARIALAIELAPGADGVVGMATPDLARICTNLVLNARDAIAEAGTIAVRVTRAHGHIEIEVRDDGTGMTPATLAQLFQPFFTTKPIGRGTGLGLATARIMLERVGASIAVTSALGRGSVFTIRLPLITTSTAPG